MLSDLDLINKVKETNDSSAMNELIQRHTGVYITIAQQYSYLSNKIQLEELKDDIVYNIHQWIGKYDPERGMKFGTYVGQMTKYMCLDLLGSTPDKIEINENVPMPAMGAPDAPTPEDLRDTRDEAAKVVDTRFAAIFDMRFPEIGRRKTWRQIAKALGLTPEGARYVFNKNIGKISKTLSTTKHP